MLGRNRYSLTWLAGLAALAIVAGPAAAQKKGKNKADKADAAEVKTAQPVKTDAAPAKTLDARAVADLIDKAVDQRLKAEKTPPSPRCDDAEFLRRVSLDLTGQIPTAEKAAAFLDSKDADKRAKLIDELLASPEYGRHQADIWKALLLPRNSDNRRLQLDPMGQWLEEKFNADTPWDKMVRELLTAAGPQDKNPAVTYFLANATVDKMTDSTAKLFLGVQLQCAQCHNHPFDKWKQTDYWGMAAFFMKVQLDGPRNPAQSTEPPGISETNNPRRGRNALPESAKRLPPKFFGGDEAKVEKDAALRPVLADWMTAPKNPFFSKAMVNRTWAQLFGRGLVNPIDDLNDNNTPSHPELLKALADQFTAGGYDLKGLIRGACNSQAYQRSSKPLAGNADASPALYSRMAVKVLTPGELFDALRTSLGSANLPPGAGRRGPAGGPRGGGNSRDQFIAFFGLDDGADPTDYQTGIPQVLRLMNGPNLNNSSKARDLAKSGKTPAEAVEALYLSTLARRPRAEELEKLTAHVAKHKGDEAAAYSDILWALINSSEFTLNK